MINFAVGPVMMSHEVKELGSHEIPYFRTPEFSELMKENEQLLLRFFHAPENSRCVFLTGSGTAAMEAAVINSFTKRDKVLVINGGSFGERFAQICSTYAIPFEQIKLEYGSPLTASHLQHYENAGFTGFLVNLHETSTGVLYDAALIGEFCRRNRLFLVVDCISAFLADDFDMAAIGADIALTGSQKALAVPPGVSILVMNEIAVKRAQENLTPCIYLNLANHLKNMERGQTPFTPAVGILIQMNARLKAIDINGVAAEVARTKELAQDFRKKITALGCSFLTESKSNAVTSVVVGEGISPRKIFETLKDEYGIYICPNGGELGEKVFRVGHIGNLTLKDNDELIKALHDLKGRGLL